MDSYNKAAEYVEADPRFASIIKVAGGPDSLILATDAVRSGRYREGKTNATPIAGDYDGCANTAFQYLCAWIGLISGYITIHQELSKAGAFITARRLIDRIRTEVVDYWRAVERIADPTAHILYYAARDGILELVTQGSGPLPKPPTLRGRILSFSLSRPLWLISLTGTSFPIAWALGTQMRGDSFSMWTAILAIYVGSACIYTASRAIVIGREVWHAHRRIGTGVWRLVKSATLPLDPTPFSVIQLVADMVARASPDHKKLTKLVVRMNAGTDSAQAIGTMLPMHDYILLPLASTQYPSATNPDQLMDHRWTLAHEIGHMVDPVERAQKGARLVAVLTALVSTALLAPLVVVHPAAAYFIAAAVLFCVLRWTLHSTLREAQADFVAMCILVSGGMTYDQLRQYLDYLSVRYRLGAMGGSLHQRSKAWIRLKMLFPSWKTIVGLQESVTKRLGQLTNAVFSGFAAVAAWYGGYYFGLYDSFTRYTWYAAAGAFLLACCSVVAQTIVIMKFDSDVSKLPPLPGGDASGDTAPRG